MNKKRLNVLAKDNHGHSYLVYLEDSRHADSNHVVVRFEGAPSGWRALDLLDIKGDRLAMDLGQGWYCINIQEIIAEISAWDRAQKVLASLSLQELQDEIARRGSA